MVGVRFRGGAVLLLLLGATIALHAEVSQSVDLSVFSSLTRLSGGSASLSGLGNAVVNLQAEGDKNVKAEFELSATTLGTGTVVNALLSVPKAYVKVRFPSFRLTAGKTRLSWGEGFYFNSGDILFGSTGTGTDLTADILRNDTAWLLSSWHSLGTYAYLETILLPPELALTPGGGNLPAFEDLRAGTRLEAKILEIRTQAGYLYRGIDREHSVFLSMQGNVFVDWYAAVATDISGESPDTGTVKAATRISWGLFHPENFQEGGSVTFRLEGLLRPWGTWQESAPAVSASGSVQPDYGLLLYPEISWSPSQFLSFQIRSVYSPLDSSALLTAGAFWKPYKGFSLLAFFNIQAGDEDDLYSFDRTGGIGFTAGMRYSF